jgi:hypothetical protein
MNNKSANIIKDWHSHVSNMVDLYEEACEYYSHKKTIYNFLIFSSLSVSSILNFSKYNIDTCYISGSLNILSITTIVFIEYLQWKTKIIKYESDAISYSKIKKLIEMHIIMIEMGHDQTYDNVILEIANLLSKVETNVTLLPHFLKNKIIGINVIDTMNYKNIESSNYASNSAETLESFNNNRIDILPNPTPKTLIIDDISDN